MECNGDPFVTTHLRENPHRQVAIVVLINANSEILLVRTRRLPNHWQALGGGIDPDDRSAAHAAAREAKEEAGIEIIPEDMVHLCDALYDFGTGTIHSFSFRLERGTILMIDDAEIAETRWFKIADAVTMPMFPAMAYTLCCLASRPDLHQ